MALVTAVDVPGEPRSWTVLGADLLPVPAVEEFLEFLRSDGASPNTVRSYAQSLRQYLDFLGLCDAGWRDVTVKLFSSFRRWLTSDTAPGVVPLHNIEAKRSVATVDLRCAAVLSFYRYQYDQNDEPAALKLYRSGRGRGDGGHHEMLMHLRRYRADRLHPVFRSRRATSRPPPILTPAQVQAILNGCARFHDGRWRGSVRDRLLFATLYETGMRLGECLGLQHRDWVLGAGGTPYVEVVAREDHPHGVRGKSGRWRRIHISHELEDLYGEYLWQLCDLGAAEIRDPLDEWWVFVNVTHGERFGALRPETVYAKVRSLKAHLGPTVPAVWTPHWFRHSHATSLLLAGVPAHVVMRRLGHRSIETTLDRYGWVTEDAELAALANWKDNAARWRLSEEGPS